MDGSMEHLDEKLLRLESMAKTEAGRKIAKERTERLLDVQELVARRDRGPVKCWALQLDWSTDWGQVEWLLARYSPKVMLDTTETKLLKNVKTIRTTARFSISGRYFYEILASPAFPNKNFSIPIIF